MLLKMLETKKGKHTGHGVQLFEKNKTYEVTCDALAKVFLEQKWAQEVRGGATKSAPSGGSFDPSEVDGSTNLNELAIDKLRATAKYLKIKGWHNAKKETLVANIAAEVFDPVLVDLTEEALDALTLEQLTAVAEAYQVETDSAEAEDLKKALLAPTE